MYLQNPQSFVVGSLCYPSEDGFEMNFQIFSSLIFAQFSFNILIVGGIFSFLGPTQIDALRPRPITYSVGIGRSDYPSDSADAITQEGPPPLELSSFLQDLLPGAVSSPVARASVSVLSPNFRRYLDTSGTPRSPPPAHRVTVSCGTPPEMRCSSLMPESMSSSSLQTRVSRLSWSTAMLVPEMRCSLWMPQPMSSSSLQTRVFRLSWSTAMTVPSMIVWVSLRLFFLLLTVLSQSLIFRRTFRLLAYWAPSLPQKLLFPSQTLYPS